MRVAVVLLAVGLVAVAAAAAEDKPAAKRIRRKKAHKSTTTTTTTTTEPPGSTDPIERQARFILGLFQTTTETPSFQRRFSDPSGAYVNDLMGMESQNEKRHAHTFEYSDTAEDKIFFGNNNGQQQQPFGGLFNGLNNNNNNNGEYGADGQLAASGSGQGGEGVPGVPNDLLQATLPVAFVGLLVLAASAVFATQVNTNSTSNQTFPLLWQLPNELQNNYPNNNNVNLGRRRRDAVHIDGEQVASPTLHANDFVDRFKDGAVLYAMMEEDENCRKKIACVFGSKVRDSPHKDMLSGVVRKLIPKRLEAFSSEFLRAAEDDSLTSEECSRWTCSKCFEI